MKIYILRHGIAEDAQGSQPDSERALTPEGKKKLRSVLRAAHAAGVAPSIILTSPYRRAIQTAQIAAEVLNYKGELLQTKTLEPGSHPRVVWDEIRVHKDEAGDSALRPRAAVQRPDWRICWARRAFRSITRRARWPALKSIISRPSRMAS